MSSKFKTIALLGASVFALAACQGQDAGSSSTASETSSAASGSESTSSATGEYAIAMITDEGGVDDRSFNQSAWEGMQAWSEETGNKVQYYQSDDSADFVPNFNTAIADGYDIIFGMGFMLVDTIAEVAPANPEQNFAIIDGEVEGDNVVSMTFKDQEAAFLAGIAAAENSTTGKVGFVGGMQTPTIERFEAGFKAGVASIDDSIEVDAQYVESFGDAATGQQIANAMYTSGVDVIYAAAGASGNGVFTEARNRLEATPDEKLWVIGVDRDQSEEGEWSGGNFTLTSTIKDTGSAIQAISNQTISDGFPGGELVEYGLAEGTVDLTEGNLSEETIAKVEEAKQQIIDGEITVPETLSE
ncbi:BMP family ABC transporter substrate-binding protein [Aerococcus agrisoli]|uniref:BMP family ABC transporter substrate-binding protein n=1 Tax=Aerococcus agrisoli TaxID=2487350 RepID=A0A3N4GA88_9LACT|nr:BMP family protein [Aerococcus agrisoli]RPA58908.1 BMP family ABC transporter substrate-binding protein [Aerococcus agrisoli]